MCTCTSIESKFSGGVTFGQKSIDQVDERNDHGLMARL